MGEGHRTGRTDREPTANPRRVTVGEAARFMDISEGAVRMRVKRGTLDAEREGGRLYVLLYADPTNDPTDRTSELIATLQDQLAAERQAHAEARRIIAGLVERIPAIEAPQTFEEEEERGGPRSGTEGPQEGIQRPWWRRVFRG